MRPKNFLLSRFSLKNCIALLILNLLCACGPTNFEKLQKVEPSLYGKDDYQSFLALEYYDFSKRLRLSKDLQTSEFFAQKGLEISSGKTFIPENPIKWKSDKLQLEESVLTQKRLERVLFWPGLKEALPIQLAHLSYLYDCWVAKESQKIFREAEDTKCHSTYLKLISEIEDYIANSATKKQPVKIQTKVPEFVRFEIFFEEGSNNINDSATKEIFRILKYLNTVFENYNIYLIGNGDSAEKNLINETLASNRARAVKNYLTKNGILSSTISISSEGENFPDIITVDNSNLFFSRSVGVYVIRGEGDIPSYPMPLLQNLYYRQEVKDAREQRGFE